MTKKNPDSRDVLASPLGNATAKPSDGAAEGASEVQAVKGVAPATPERVPAPRAVEGTEGTEAPERETAENDAPPIPTHTGRRSVAPLKGENAEINRLSSNHGLTIIETKTARIYALMQPTLKADFAAWCKLYGLSLSEGLAVACRLCMERFPMDKGKRPKHRGRIKP